LRSKVLFWNPAAEAIAGYVSAELLSRDLPLGFSPVDRERHEAQDSGPVRRTLAETGRDGEILRLVALNSGVSPTERSVLVNLRHRQGHSLPAMLRQTPLRDTLGRRFGTLLRFHPTDETDSLPHGVTEEDGSQEKRVEQGQADMEDRLEEAWREWNTNGIPLSILWIAVDQARLLRKTHGRDACEAMLAIVERTLLHGLRPTEILGRWGTSEFLVLCHERTEDMLAAHAHHVCGQARTADFRWWGDRVSLTFSIGAGQASEGENLRSLLKRVQQGMQESAYAGGNQVVLRKTSGTGGLACSQY
jgi:diguanylate cyclase (GGDEF)-like protein